MTKRLLTFIIALFVCAAATRAGNPEDFTVESVPDGSKFQLSRERGKVVALHFLLKTECPFCLKLTRDYAALAATTPNVLHVFLKPDSAEEIQKWAGKIGQSAPQRLPKIYRDPEASLAKRFGIPDGYSFHGEKVHFPALVVLDGEGKELFRHVGKSNSDRVKPADFSARLAAAQAKSRTK